MDMGGGGGAGGFIKLNNQNLNGLYNINVGRGGDGAPAAVQMVNSLIINTVLMVKMAETHNFIITSLLVEDMAVLVYFLIN